MSRSGALVALLLLGATAVTCPRSARAEEPQTATTRMHMAGFRFDYGAAASTLALRYMRAREELTPGVPGKSPGSALWFGYGLDAGIISQTTSSVDAGLVTAVGRVTFLGDTGSYGLELTAGVASGHGETRGVVAPGVFFGVYYVDFGYSYAAPIAPLARTDWLASHQFSIRIHVPVATTRP